MYVIYESFLLYVYRTESQTNHGRVQVQDNDDWPVADAPDEEPSEASEPSVGPALATVITYFTISLGLLCQCLSLFIIAYDDDDDDDDYNQNSVEIAVASISGTDWRTVFSSICPVDLSDAFLTKGGTFSNIWD